MSRCGGSRGFTLLELAVVLVVAGLAVGLTVPTLRIQEGPFADASLIAGTLRRAASMAARTGEPVEVRVRPSAGTIEIHLAGVLVEPLKTLSQCDGRSVLLLILPSGRVFGDPITCEGRSSGRWSIVVNPLTGQVDVVQPE